VARPTKFTDDARDALLRAKAQGKTDRECADEAGLDYTTLYRWLTRGERGEEPYRSFQSAYRDVDVMARRRKCSSALASIRQTLQTLAVA
jgi:transposase